MYIIDLDGRVVEVTNLPKAIRQAKAFLSWKHIDDSYAELDAYLQKYWIVIYAKLLCLKYPEYSLFHFQINPVANRYKWECVMPIIRLLPSRSAAVKLAKRVADFYKAEVRLTGAEPFKESGSYFRCTGFYDHRA